MAFDPFDPTQSADGSVLPLDDGGVEVSLAGTEASPPTIDTDEDINMVPTIKKKKSRVFIAPRLTDADAEKVDGEEFLDQLGQLVCEEFGADHASRSEWEVQKAKELELFMAYMPPKTWPWKDASNVSVPFITMAALQFQARAFEAIIPGRDTVKAFATGPEDEERGKRVEKFMNYQLLYEMDEFESGMDSTLMQLPIIGDAFRKTYFDPVKDRPMSINVNSTDVVVNYGVSSDESIERLTHILYMVPNDIKRRIVANWFDAEMEDITPGSASTPVDQALKESADRVIGLTESYAPDSRPRVVLEQHRLVDLDGDGLAEPYVVTVDFETQKVWRITERFYVNPFGEKVEIDYFTHYQFIPNPEGFYGIGFGTLLRGLNESANTILNEVIDAGALANLQGGFVSRRAGIKKGMLEFKMGEYQEVDAYIEDIRKSIFHLDFKGPNATLYSTLGLLFEYAKLVSSISETMTGQLPASDTPASTVVALLEEGRKMFSAIHKRIHRSFKRELRKIFRLNALYLDEEKYFKVLGENRVPEGDPLVIALTDFTDNLDVLPVSDPSLASRAEKSMKARAVQMEVLNNPLTRDNEQAIRKATLDYYIALDVPDPEALIPPPPEPQDVAPVEENAAIIAEQPVTVLPQQDHANHLEVHQELVDGPFADQLSPTSKSALERHMKEHLAGLYLSQQQPEEEEQLV